MPLNCFSGIVPVSQKSRFQHPYQNLPHPRRVSLPDFGKTSSHVRFVCTEPSPRSSRTRSLLDPTHLPRNPREFFPHLRLVIFLFGFTTATLPLPGTPFFVSVYASCLKLSHLHRRVRNYRIIVILNGRKRRCPF